ncbi:unnamed protein product [Urochloa humidicola]
MATAAAAADGPPVEPQSLKKLSLRSLKRSTDLFAPAHADSLFTPKAESKRIRAGCKVRAEYGAVEDLAPEQGRGGHGKRPAEPSSSTEFPLPGKFVQFLWHSILPGLAKMLTEKARTKPLCLRHICYPKHLNL